MIIFIYYTIISLYYTNYILYDLIISLQVGIISLYYTTIYLYDAIISLYNATVYLYYAIISLYHVTISLYGITTSLYDATISLYHVIITLYDAMTSLKMQLLKNQDFNFFFTWIKKEDVEKVFYKLVLKDLFPAFPGEKITPDIIGRLTLDKFSCLVVYK